MAPKHSEIDRVLKEMKEELNTKMDLVLKELVTSNEAMKELKSSVNALTESGKEHHEAIRDLIAGAKRMENENAAKDRKIEALGKKAELMEQMSRMNNVILTGLKIKTRSYAGAVAGGEEGGMQTSSMEEQIEEFLESQGIDFEASNIESCVVEIKLFWLFLFSGG